MFLTPDVYSSEGNSKSNGTKAVIVLPEIFGLTPGITEIADRFAQELQMLSFALDTFYPLTGEQNAFDYATDVKRGFELMQQLKGEVFLQQFNGAVGTILSHYPKIQEIIVCGFCFGGRLAFLSGVNSKVTSIISFYGGGVHQPFFEGKSVIDTLIKARPMGVHLKILAFFGLEDASIPKEDCEKTRQKLISHGFNYKDRYLPAGHAFFNHKRPTYVPEAAQKAWGDVVEFLL